MWKITGERTTNTKQFTGLEPFFAMMKKKSIATPFHGKLSGGINICPVYTVTKDSLTVVRDFIAPPALEKMAGWEWEDNVIWAQYNQNLEMVSHCLLDGVGTYVRGGDTFSEFSSLSAADLLGKWVENRNDGKHDLYSLFDDDGAATELMESCWVGILAWMGSTISDKDATDEVLLYNGFLVASRNGIHLSAKTAEVLDCYSLSAVGTALRGIWG